MADCPTPLDRIPPDGVDPLQASADDPLSANLICAESSDPTRAERCGGSSHFLCLCENEPTAVALVLAFEACGLGLNRISWVANSREAIGRLRDEPFEAILVDIPPLAGTKIGRFGGADGTAAMAPIRALRTAGCDAPIVLVARLLTDADWTEACDLDCDVFLSPKGWNSPALGAVVKRAVARGQIARDNHRLTIAQERRLVRERAEAEQLLAQQWQIIAELEAIPELLCDRTGPQSARAAGARGAGEEGPPGGSNESAAACFAAQYAALLRTYVLMGAGSLATEIAAFADTLQAARVPSTEALELHLHSVEKLVKGMGSRSARHVVARADLLAVELMTRLARGTERSAEKAAAKPGLPSAVRNVTGQSGIELTDESIVTPALFRG